MDIPEPVIPPVNPYSELNEHQLVNRLDNLREWHHLSNNAKDLLEEISQRFTAQFRRFIPQLHTVFPNRNEHPKVIVVFTEFRVKNPDDSVPIPEYLLDVYCRVDREGKSPEYYTQTFDRDFKPTAEQMSPLDRDFIVQLMGDRITKV